MSQHPIDDLFANQLRDHGVKPERASWDELQRRMNEKKERKSPVMWWYASAASVAVLLLAAWWLWSGDEAGQTGLATNRIAKQRLKETAPAKAQSGDTVLKTDEIKTSEEPAIAYQKSSGLHKSRPARPDRPVAETAFQVAQKPVELEKSADPIWSEKAQEPETVLTAVAPKQAERTLVVKIAEPEIKPTVFVASREPEASEFNDTNANDQPKKKRFRLGRVLRQFNKIKAGEPVEWEEVGVQPGAFMARATEKVQESKEKISNSYENLRYNAFKKNPNNK